MVVTEVTYVVDADFEGELGGGETTGVVEDDGTEEEELTGDV